MGKAKLGAPTPKPQEPQQDGPAQKTARGGVSRRDLCVGLGYVAVTLGLGAGVKFAGAETIMHPPGGQDEDLLMARCIHCQRCVEACHKNAIVPAGMENGFLNMRTPTMDFHAGWCDFCEDANGGFPLCVEVCPTKALDLERGAKHEDVVIGRPLLMKDWCLAYRLTHCRDCYDACDFDAIELDDNKRPHLVLDKCNGCGACEYVCRSMTAGTPVAGATHRAIIVVPADQAKEV